MTCEHAFVPFPGSRRNLYCSFCGTGKDAFACSVPRANSGRRSRSGTRETADAVTVAPVQPTLFDDPDADAAEDVLAARRFEKRVREIIAERNPSLDDSEVEGLVAEMKQIGGDLDDLDWFAQHVAAQVPADRRQPVDESDDSLGRGAGL